MNINICIDYPDDIEEFQKYAYDILSSIIITKLNKIEIEELIKILKDNNKITL